MRQHAPTRWLASVLLSSALIVAGCAGFAPRSVEDLAFLERRESQDQGKLRVSVAVPTVEEARALFDTRLDDEGIQPVWFEFQNLGDEPAWFHPYSVDPGYFTPLEVAWLSHRSWSPSTNGRIDEFYRDQAVPALIQPGSSVSGFIFVNLSRGTKHIPVTLLTGERQVHFEFFVKVPGLRTDYDSVDFETLYPSDGITDLENETAVRRWAEALSCCTFNRDGSVKGDPINVILIGSDEALKRGFLRTGWSETEGLGVGSAVHTAAVAVSGEGYPHAPFSSLYVLGRRQDIGLQKARQNIHQRNHIRLWLAPVTYRATPVWIGQISRDIGSRLTSKSATLTTHKIDPDIDDARDGLLLDLYAAKVIDAYGFVSGVGSASPGAPRGNLTGDPYFTDGFRAVVFLLDEPVPGEPVRFLSWENMPEN